MAKRNNNFNNIIITVIIYTLIIYLLFLSGKDILSNSTCNKTIGVVIKNIVYGDFNISDELDICNDGMAKMTADMIQTPVSKYKREKATLKTKENMVFFLDNKYELDMKEENTIKDNGEIENADSSEEQKQPLDNTGAQNENGEQMDDSKASENNKVGDKIQTGAQISNPRKLDVDISKLTYDFLMKNYYTVVSATTLRPDDIDAGKLLGIDMKMKTGNDKPQILIYHTHGQEGFTDTVPNDPSTRIIGVGDYLVELLRNHGYNVIHITDSFDYVDGVFDRSKAYDYAYNKIAQVLAENPSIEVVIDLHRDGVGENTHLVTEVNGKPTAQIMFFNGISRLNSVGEIGYLYNPYRTENLAMSLRMKLLAEQYYKGFTRRNYIQAYQYNLHMRPKSMLIEAGAQTNSFEEVKNAMEPLADLLDKCLSGE